MQKIVRLISFALISLMCGCNSIESDAENAKTTIAASCKVDELKQVDTISADCRNAVYSLLPQPEDNVSNRFIEIGSQQTDSISLFYYINTDSVGQNAQINIDSIEIIEINNGDTTKIDKNDIVISSYAIDSTLNASISCVLDYSGSMRDADINNGIEVYKSILTSFNVGHAVETRIFSDTVMLKQGFTRDSNLIEESLIRDSLFTRGATALYDGIGFAIETIKDRNDPIRIVIVSTDGLENNSKQYQDINLLINNAKENNIHIVVMSALLSDFKSLKKLSLETNGLFIYTKDAISLMNGGKKIVNALSTIQAVKVSHTKKESNANYMIVYKGK